MACMRLCRCGCVGGGGGGAFAHEIYFMELYRLPEPFVFAPFLCAGEQQIYVISAWNICI